MEHRYCFLNVEDIDWTKLTIPDAIGFPFYLFHEEKLCNNIREIQHYMGDGVKLAYAMKANPWLLQAAARCADFIEVCSAGELSLCKRAGIPGESIILDGVWRNDSLLCNALDMDVARFGIDSVEQMNQLLRLVGNKKVKVFLRVSSGNHMGMTHADVLQCIGMSRKMSHIVNIVGIQYYPGTQRTQSWQVRRDLGKLTEWLTWCESLSDFHLIEVEFGVGLGFPYFQEDDPVQYAEMFQLVSTYAKQLKNRYEVTYEAGRILAASCGIYVTKVFAQKQLDTKRVLYCLGGSNHLRYHGGTLGVRAPRLQGIHANPLGTTGTMMICGCLCSESDVMVRECHNLDLNTSIGDTIMFLGAGAYSPTEALSLFLGMELPEIVLCNSDEYGFPRIHCVRKSRAVDELMYDRSDVL